MPDLMQSLHPRDLGHLRIVASLWGVDLVSVEPGKALQELSAALLDAGLVREVVEALPPQARAALEALAAGGGRMPWAAFSRRFGEIRTAGPGRRDRERFYLDPASPAEHLFYRALLERAFFDTPSGAQEFAYIPDDLIPLLPGRTGSRAAAEPLGRPATPKERQYPLLTSDRLLDDATTLLAALRMDLPPPETALPSQVVRAFLETAAVIVRDSPRPEAVKAFLEQPRREALAMLVKTWMESEIFDELRMVPGLICEGEWQNQPLATRQFLLDLFHMIPPGKWWSLSAFECAVKERFPDFQRPAGDYDSWFVKRAADGAYLRGFEHWEEVDGALIRYLISGPLFWLGMADLASAETDGAMTAFRPLPPASCPLTPETGKLHVTSQGKVVAPRSLPRAARYQIARFCEWEEQKPDEYHYRVTTHSLKSAHAQELKVSQLLAVLVKNAAAEIPPALVKALKRWEAEGTQARLELQVVLRVSSPEVLAELRKSRAGRFLGEALGPAAVVVKAGAQRKVLAALAEMGLLAEAVHEEHGGQGSG